MAKIYDSYPLWIVFVVILLSALVYIAGAYIMFKLSIITGILFLVYVAFLEIQIYKEGCVNCCYYGKFCAFGRGKIAKIFFKKGNPKKFCEKKLSFKDFIPQILVVLVPVIVGVALLISRGFDMLILIALIYPILSWFAVNPIMYGKLTCPHCKQGSICCPALEFFSKGRKK